MKSLLTIIKDCLGENNLITSKYSVSSDQYSYQCNSEEDTKKFNDYIKHELIHSIVTNVIDNVEPPKEVLQESDHYTKVFQKKLIVFDPDDFLKYVENIIREYNKN